jgi:hypothetical protein
MNRHAANILRVVGGTKVGSKRGRGAESKEIVVIAVELKSPKGLLIGILISGPPANVVLTAERPRLLYFSVNKYAINQDAQDWHWSRRSLANVTKTSKPSISTL